VFGSPFGGPTDERGWSGGWSERDAFAHVPRVGVEFWTLACALAPMTDDFAIVLHCVGVGCALWVSCGQAGVQG